MKKMLTENLGYKLAAVIGAIILWMVVVNVNDPVSTEEYTVNVTLQNASTVTDAGMVYSVLNGTDTVTVTVKAQRSVLRDLESSDISVTADFNDITQMNTIPLQVTSAKYDSKIERYVLDHSNLMVELEEGATKEFGIVVKTTGTPEEGYTVGSTTVTPNIVTVSGPASVVDQIDAIWASLAVDNRSTTVRTGVSLTAVDSAGKAISSDRLTFSQNEVLVNVSFLETKSVSLKVNTTGSCADGYRLEEAVSSPTTVTIAGSAEVLSQTETIELPESLLDITDASADVTAEIDISAYLPEGIQLAGEQEAQVTLTAKIAELETMEFTIPTSEINLMNTPVNMQADFGGIESITFTLQGAREDLDALREEDVTASVDLTGMSEGTQRADVIVVTPENVYIDGDVWIDVTLYSTVTQTEETNTGTE